MDNISEIKCGLNVNGISDELISETFFNTLEFFEKRGYKLRNKVKFLNKGKITIIGRGHDGRCAFCDYFRQAIVKHFKEKNTKGTIDLIKCPFNPDKSINYTPEVVEARKKLLDLYTKLKNKN